MFTKEFLDFFNELENNNSKEWFDINRKRYEKHVKNPSKELCSNLIDIVLGEQAFVKDIQPKHCIFRINRDIRFSKDKTPYKTQVGMVISENGKKDHTTPSLYLELSNRHVRLYSGSYSLPKEELSRLREKIYKETDRFLSILKSEEFVENFGELRGERNKRIPKPWNELEETCPYIFNKSFYFFKEYPAEILLKENFISIILEDYQLAEPINSFIIEAIKA